LIVALQQLGRNAVMHRTYDFWRILQKAAVNHQAAALRRELSSKYQIRAWVSVTKLDIKRPFEGSLPTFAL
ncbi:MAG: hypothetical protein ACYTX0_55735, partial [Nostoc sp.]